MLSKDEYKDLQQSCSAKLRYAQKKGQAPIINGPTKCVDCGDVALMLDHRNYYKPLEVEPVCRKCNMARGPAYPYCEDLNQVRAGLEKALPDDQGDYTGHLSIDFDFDAYDLHAEYLRIFGTDVDSTQLHYLGTPKRDGKVAISKAKTVYLDGESHTIDKKYARYKTNEYAREYYRKKRAVS